MFTPALLATLAVSPITTAPTAPQELLAPTAIAALAPQLDYNDATEPSANFSYDFIQLGYFFSDFDGQRLEGSFELDGPWIAVGRLAFLDDLTILSVGAGYVHSVDADGMDGLDLIGTVELEYADIDVIDEDEFGVRLRGGARYAATNEVELFGGVSYSSTLEDADQDFGFDIGALYNIDTDWSAFAEVDFAEETQVGLGVRYYF